MKKVFKSAFTLPEIIVAFSVLVMVIMASTSVVVSVIRGNQENENTLIAYFLAQEAMEGLRNIRDSNWLLGADFHGKIGAVCAWGADCLPFTAEKKHYFAIDRQTGPHVAENYSGNPVGIQEISRYAPWKLKNITINEQPDKSALIQEKFHRYLEITPKTYGDDTGAIAKYQIFAVVVWHEGSRNKQIRLGTELTDWKGGES